MLDVENEQKISVQLTKFQFEKIFVSGRDRIKK